MLEAYKDGSLRVNGDTYLSIRDYESKNGLILEKTYPFWLVVNMKRMLGWRLLCRGGVYYEQAFKDYYKIQDGSFLPCKKPKGAVEVAWDRHPFKADF